MRLHEEALAAAQRRVLRRLGGATTPRGFYLGGGTAVALQLGHRRSVDFDWFSAVALGDALTLARSLEADGLRVRVEQTGPGTLHATMSRVRVTFLEYRYPLLHSPLEWPEYGCLIASLDDLACMKLSAVAQRGAKKDFVDIYAIGRRHRPLPELLRLYQRKYAVRDVGHVLRGLAYFDDAETERMPRMLWDVDWRTVKATIRRWVRAFAG